MKRLDRKIAIMNRDRNILASWRDCPHWRHDCDGKNVQYIENEVLETLGIMYKLAPNTIKRIVYKQMNLEYLMDRLS
jgi:hypothetical protein